MSNSLYVYRVENNNGDGCYYATFRNYKGIYPWAIRSHEEQPCTPRPEWDGLDRQYDHIFGFKNLNQLQAWFTSQELKNLDKMGFNIKRVRFTDVRYGGKQVMGRRSDYVK